MEYLHNGTRNATYLMRMGEAAAQNQIHASPQAGRQLVDSALQLRGYALLYRAQLYLRHVAGAVLLREAGRQLSTAQHLASQLALISIHQAARFSALL
jgi:hypothetical protein